jgi:hypothetical protein
MFKDLRVKAAIYMFFIIIAGLYVVVGTGYMLRHVPAEYIWVWLCVSWGIVLSNPVYSVVKSRLLPKIEIPPEESH